MKPHAVAALAAFAILAILSPATAHDYTVGALKLVHPWARATPKGAAVGGGYLKITNTGSVPDRLIGGTSDVAARFVIHEMKMEGGVMKMRPLADGLAIGPGATVELKPGGYHVMFMGLKKQLVEGERFKSALVFEKAGEIEIEFVIDKLAAQSSGATGHDGAHGGMRH